MKLDLDALDKLIDAVCIDEWGTDTVKNEGEYGPGEDAVSGFDSYCVIDSKGNTLLDTLNFDQSEIHEEYDDDYFRAWDEPARKVAEFVAAFNPQTARALIDRLRKAEAASKWISVDERLPEVGVGVMVYTPPTAHDWPGSVNIRFDCIDPDADEPTSWLNHNEHYEHFCCVAKPEGTIGPSEKAPYTHWMPIPATPDSTPTDSAEVTE